MTTQSQPVVSRKIVRMMDDKKPLISIVSPVYGCGGCLSVLCERLIAVLGTISEQFEIILVNDASPDAAWDKIEKLAAVDRRIMGVDLARNFGQHYAITAGLDFARGDWVVVMDCDLQDMPEEIPTLYQKALEGYDIVVGRRSNRQDSWLKKAASRLFYRVFSYFSGSDVDNRIGNFGIYSRSVIQSIRRFQEQNRSFGLFALWVGFNRIEIDIRHAVRLNGKSTYSFAKMMRLALDSIIAHSNKLLYLTIQLGLALSCLSILYAAWMVVRYFLWSTPVIGWTSLMVSIFFTAGLIIGTIGIVGLYVGKIFEEVKGRPLYIVKSTTFEINNEES